MGRGVERTLVMGLLLMQIEVELGLTGAVSLGQVI